MKKITKFLVVVFSIIAFGNTGQIYAATTPVNLTIVSDSQTQTDLGNAVELEYIHDQWTNIPGAKWIWATQGPTDSHVEESYTFTSSFDWNADVTELTLDIAADNFYSASLNGNDIDAGVGMENSGQYLAVDNYVIPTSFLIQGTNTLTIEAIGEGIPEYDRFENPLGLIYKLAVSGTVEDEVRLPQETPENNSGGNSNGGGSSTSKKPKINIKKNPIPQVLPFGGGMVTYYYTLTNTGKYTINDVTVADNGCAGLIYISGDLDSDSNLDLNETWKYTCTVFISTSSKSIVTAKGEANGFTATDTAGATVSVAIPKLPNTGMPPTEKSEVVNIIILSTIIFLGGTLGRIVLKKVKV